MDQGALRFADEQRALIDSVSIDTPAGLYLHFWPRFYGFTTALTRLAVKLVRQSPHLVWVQCVGQRMSYNFKQRIRLVAPELDLKKLDGEGRLVITDGMPVGRVNLSQPCFVLIDGLIAGGVDIQNFDHIREFFRMLPKVVVVAKVIESSNPVHNLPTAIAEELIPGALTPDRWCPETHLAWPPRFQWEVWALLLAHKRRDCVISALPRGVLMYVIGSLAEEHLFRVHSVRVSRADPLVPYGLEI